MLFSIIIPVYNVKDYLERCVQSIEEQDSAFQTEVILVDDGSNDGSSELCDSFLMHYKNIKVIHKQNGGLSDARNTGLKSANGDYIIFLDSDDFLSEGAIPFISGQLKTIQPDILYLEVMVLENGKKKKILTKQGLLENRVYDGCSAMIAELQLGKFQALSVIGIYRKSYLVNNNFWFKKGILHEDEEWTPRVMANATRVVCAHFCYYMYDTREGSITQTRDKTRNAADLIDTCYNLNDEFNRYHNRKLRTLFKGYIARLYMAAVSECIMRGDVCKIKRKIRRSFVLFKWANIKDCVKILIFFISPKIYARLLENAREDVEKRATGW